VVADRLAATAALAGRRAVAVCVVVHLETMELFPPPGTIAPPSAVGYGPYPNAFQLSRVAAHEYGNRVGIFRVMEALDRYAIPATVAIDAQLARSNPFLVDQCAMRDWEFIATASPTTA